MTINVYWACYENEWMRAVPPSLVARTVYSKFPPRDENPQLAYNKCPAFNGYLTNLYEMRSIYDYEFYLEDGAVKTTYYNDEFFDEHVLIRDYDKKMFSFIQRFIFFTDEESLLMTGYEFPNYEDNNITKSCHLTPGQFDIGKWFRNTEFPFFLREGIEEFKIEQGEVYSYFRFHTDEKINFIQFKMTDELIDIMMDGRAISTNTTKFIPGMLHRYKAFNTKGYILKRIQENLLS